MNEFPHFLQNDRRDGTRAVLLTKTVINRFTDIERCFTLLKRIKDGVEPLKALLEAHLKKEGLAAIEKCGAQAATV